MEALANRHSRPWTCQSRALILVLEETALHKPKYRSTDEQVCARCEGKTAPLNNDCRERIVTILTFKGRRASKRVTVYADESAERRVEQARMTDDVMVDPCPAVNTPTRTPSPVIPSAMSVPPAISSTASSSAMPNVRRPSWNLR